MAPTPFQYRFAAHLPAQPQEERLRSALRALVAATEMTPFGAETVSIDEEEFNAIQMIAESHIGIHGHGRAAEANVWSCKPFDPQEAAEALDKTLGGVWYYRRVSHEGYEEP